MLDQILSELQALREEVQYLREELKSQRDRDEPNDVDTTLDEVYIRLGAGRKIGAIKAYRELFPKVDLMTAKTEVERLEQQPIPERLYPNIFYRLENREKAVQFLEKERFLLRDQAEDLLNKIMG